MNLRHALNRVSYGQRPEQIQELNEMGWENWVKKQLALKNDDSISNTHIQNIAYKIHYTEKDKEKEKQLTIFRYNATAKEIWDSIKGQDNPPRWLIDAGAAETALITWTKAIFSKHQIFELLVEFWHNHFNVSVDTDDYISCQFPIYDRDVIRKNALGNFRKFTEDVAKSPSMLLYLDNAYSKASPANENYARELLELHTLGASHYYNHLYDNWKAVPKTEKGISKGYIDEDIYEIARAFTGWTIGNGEENDGITFPSTGQFHYCDQWHDDYQKRILGQEFESHQDAMVDGQKVLDLVCYHRGTALHLCTKLCQWFVADNPSEALLQKTMKIWLENVQEDDQILKVVESILISDEFKKGVGTKIKRPNHLLFSLASTLDLQPDLDWVWLLKEMGWKQFSWPTPTGHPDSANYWLNTDMLLKRWNSIPSVLYLDMEKNGSKQLSKETLQLENTKIDPIINHWANRLLGEKLSPSIHTEIKKQLLVDMEEMVEQEWSVLEKEYPKELEYKLMQVVSLIALSPTFHKR